MNWYLAVLKKYADFNGRARRKEYWLFFLFNILVSVALSIIDSILGTGRGESGTGLLGGLYVLAIFLPSLAVSVRRLHDTGRSGWWMLISLIPVIGSLVLFVFFCFDSQTGTNRYGINPKELNLLHTDSVNQSKFFS